MRCKIKVEVGGAHGSAWERANPWRRSVLAEEREKRESSCWKGAFLQSFLAICFLWLSMSLRLK